MVNSIAKNVNHYTVLEDILAHCFMSLNSIGIVFRVITITSIIQVVGVDRDWAEVDLVFISDSY